MKLKSSLTIAAAILIFLGFGMIHATTQWVEKTGSLMIGIGSLYLIVLLIRSIYTSKK